ncbi:MAG: hypothetical protein ACFB8W_25120 [Elainellaceae cyanobacterium]
MQPNLPRWRSPFSHRDILAWSNQAEPMLGDRPLWSMSMKYLGDRLFSCLDMGAGKRSPLSPYPSTALARTFQKAVISAIACFNPGAFPKIQRWSR